MKITAILPDDIVRDVREYAGGKNLTDSLIKALRDWLYLKRIEKLNKQLSKAPVEFEEDYDAEKIRKLSNRE